MSSFCQVAVEIPNVKRVKMRRDSQYPTKRDHMICKCLSLSITYAATIGGLITITGTSTNLIFAEQFNTYVAPRVLEKGRVEKAELVWAPFTPAAIETHSQPDWVSWPPRCADWIHVNDV